MADYFHLFAGTSTGGLIALALTSPKRVSAAELDRLLHRRRPERFPRGLGHEIASSGGSPPVSCSARLREAVERRLGTQHALRKATRDLLVTSYDMTGSEPYFFKRWRALENPGSATSRSPKRRSPPWRRRPTSPRTGSGASAGRRRRLRGQPLRRRDRRNARPPERRAGAAEAGRSSSWSRSAPANSQTGYSQQKVSKWGELGWVLGGGEPPILSAMLGGASDGADYGPTCCSTTPPGRNGSVPRSGSSAEGPATTAFRSTAESSIRDGRRQPRRRWKEALPAAARRADRATQTPSSTRSSTGRWPRDRFPSPRPGRYVPRGVARAGIEPTTPRFSVVCSTN